MTRKNPTDVQKRLLNFIQEYDAKYGYPPTIREMQDKVGISSTSVVDYNLKSLEALGIIKRDSKNSRGLRVVMPIYEQVQGAISVVHQTAKDLLSIPLVGRIVASQPVPMPSSFFNYFDADTTIDVALSMLPVRKSNITELFALQVEGDSMIEDMVNDGDIVVMQSDQEIGNGDMVAVWLSDEDETTLKRFYREKDRIRLQPANPTMEPIYISDKRSIEIQGKVLLIITPMKKT